MQCDICFRAGGSKLPFLCAIDARNQLYPSRIRSARILLENDSLQQEISALVSKAAEDGHNAKSGTATSRIAINTAESEKSQAVDRTNQIIAVADELRVKIENARAEVARKKASIARRKSELASASNGSEARRARQSDEVEKSIRMIKYKWNAVHTKFISSRQYLCEEAAKLYGFRRRRSASEEEYVIGRVGIVDLRALNTASPAQISTSLSHIVHLLMLCMHYLAIRLPAEVMLPRPEQPLPTIYSIGSSYIHRPLQTLGNTNGQSSNASPTASRHEQPTQPRARPLHITKPLPILVHEDPVAYSLFLEGVVLLAYNIAWVCKTQGVSIGGEGNFDDVCNIGKNLYNLLIATKPRSQPPTRVSSNHSTATRSNTKGSNDPEDKKSSTIEPLMGKYSHGTATNFLGGAQATEYIRGWKLATPRYLTDTLKALLQNEVANKEWEVVNEGHWEVNDEMGDDGVVVGGLKEGGEFPPRLGVGQSFMSCREVGEAIGGLEEMKAQGTSGWTKLKPR